MNDREEIKNRLSSWVDEGLLCSKRSTGIDYASIKRAIARGELFATSFDNVVTRDIDVRDAFERLVIDGRLMNASSVMARTGLTSAYKINLACADGDMVRFGKLGNGCVLFIK